MKGKRLITLLAAMMLMVMMVLPAYAEDASAREAVQVQVDGSLLPVEAYLVDGRTMVPLRAIFERLSATVEWDDATETITASKNAAVIILAIGKTDAKIGGKDVTLDVPPMLINSSTYVPLRFVSEALGAEVTFDDATMTAKVSTGSSCSGGGQVHSGTIQAAGETWGICGSPHLVKGDFLVEGKESPVLTIEAGAVVRFENDAQLTIGHDAPGGLVIKGTKEKPVVLTADTAGPEAGFWRGIQLYGQALRGNLSIEGARIEYAGESWKGALYAEPTNSKEMTITVKDTEFKNNLYAGIHLVDNAKLSDRSENVTVTGTKASLDGGGYPIITDAAGSQLPKGKYTGNEVDAIHLDAGNTPSILIARSTTWKNLGIPYDTDRDVEVYGASNPTLTIEPGVHIRWAQYVGLRVGQYEQGGVTAVGTKDSPIVFSGKTEREGAWGGIHFFEVAGKKNNRLENTVIQYAETGVTVEGDLGEVLKNSILENNGTGILLNNAPASYTDLQNGHGNSFKGNGEDQVVNQAG